MCYFPGGYMNIDVLHVYMYVYVKIYIYMRIYRISKYIYAPENTHAQSMVH